MKNKELLQKYNVSGPRYTSYPTVPFWKNVALKPSQWLKVLEKQKAEAKSLGIYIHLPFCESLCTFCGCHKRITKNHQVETPYIDTVLKEWDLYQPFLFKQTRIKELHLGGGTPTFFAPEALVRLTKGIFRQQQIDPNACELSFEAHPGSTSAEHLLALHEVGSNNPDGVEIKEKKDANGKPLDGIPFHPYYTVHDILGVGVFLMVFSAIVFFPPEMGGYFLEYNNFIPADPLKTPAHIAPVWYFTPFYSILRAITSSGTPTMWESTFKTVQFGQ
jgi:hypothetical protein